MDDNSENFRNTSRAEFAYRQLLDAIHNKVFQQGDRIREEEIASNYGISRTPVRQALQRLQTRGLLDYAPSRGLIVAELSRQQILELYAVRELLEGAAARLAAQHAGPTDIAAMRSLLEDFRAAAPNPEKLARINRMLHDAIYEAAHNRYLNQSLNDLSDTLALLKGTTFSVDMRWKSADAENTLIVDAIAARDADAAEKAARAHIREAQKVRLRLLFQS